MSVLKVTMAVSVLALLHACVSVGPEISKMPVLQRPQGAMISIDVKQAGTRQRRKYEGELIEVHDDGMVVAAKSDASSDVRLILFPWSVIYRIQAPQLPGFEFTFISSGARVKSATEKMNLVSRYPQKLSPELMARLLASYHQESIDPLAH
jgi:hypothetical protein